MDRFRSRKRVQKTSRAVDLEDQDEVSRPETEVPLQDFTNREIESEVGHH